MGSLIAPSIGGFLANPAIQYPNIFVGTIWEKYPYALPGVVVRLLFFSLTSPNNNNWSSFKSAKLPPTIFPHVMMLTGQFAHYRLLQYPSFQLL